MSNLSNILNFIADYGYTNSSFEKKCHLPNATLSNAKKRGSDLTSDVIETISNYIGQDLEVAGYHIMDMRPLGRQELAILSSDEAEKIISKLGSSRKPENDFDNENKATQASVTVEHLARALADQAQANKIQAAANDKYAAGFSALATVLERVEKNMATGQTLADLETNYLKRTLAASLTVAKDQEDAMKEIRNLASLIRAQKKAPSRGSGKGRDRIDGGLEKTGKNPA